LAAISRYFVHIVVLIVAVTVSGYTSMNKADLSTALGVVNAAGLSMGQGGSADTVALGRSGTIIKPLDIPNSAPVQHTPTQYTVRAGEDLYAIATKFNISADDLRWSNPDKLTRTDLVRVGDKLLIPPVPGVVVTAKPNDSLAAIAAAYKVQPQSVSDFNYMRDPEHVNPGDVLVVPNGRGPSLWPRRASNDAPHMGPYANGKFTYGQCTWYVASRRNVPWTGDAWMWAGGAKAMGFPEGPTPEPGAIMVTWESVYYGHVAYVEQVNADGSFVVSEMNFKAWDVIDTRTIKNTSAVPLITFIY
jgi:surface antigen